MRPGRFYSGRTERSMAEEPIHETTTEARAGDGNPVNRYVLYASLALIVVVFIIILAVGWV
jgi:hypothetical protein